MGFFTNKVKSVIKQKIANNLISGFQNAAFGQPKKLAAKLASKSPLDMSQSPVAHMGQVANPYNYGVATYPQETTNLGDGHYIIFDVIENNKTNYGAAPMTDFDDVKSYPESLGQVGEGKLNAFQGKRLQKLKAQGFAKGSEKILRNQTTGINSKSRLQTHTRISDSIILYTPPAVKFDYKVGYENIDTGIVGVMAGFFDGKTSLGESLKGMGANFLETVVKSAIEIALPGIGAAVDKGRGFSQNPNAEMVFKSVPFRTFSFPYEFAPKNEKEARELRSTGKEKAEKIRASADRERTIELANAYRDAEEVRGEGDAEAAKIYANAYQKDPEFYAFVRSLNAYKQSFSNKGDIMLVEPDSDFFKYLKDQNAE